MRGSFRYSLEDDGGGSWVSFAIIVDSTGSWRLWRYFRIHGLGSDSIFNFHLRKRREDCANSQCACASYQNASGFRLAASYSKILL